MKYGRFTAVAAGLAITLAFGTVRAETILRLSPLSATTAGELRFPG
jgi:hypothetical protein